MCLENCLSVVLTLLWSLWKLLVLISLLWASDFWTSKPGYFPNASFILQQTFPGLWVNPPELCPPPQHCEASTNLKIVTIQCHKSKFNNRIKAISAQDYGFNFLTPKGKVQSILKPTLKQCWKSLKWVYHIYWSPIGKCSLKGEQTIPQLAQPHSSPGPLLSAAVSWTSHLHSGLNWKGPAQQPTGDTHLFHVDATKRLLLLYVLLQLVFLTGV